MYKHYIRVNDNGEVIAAFCNAFQEPQDGDILICETNERHFNLPLQVDGVYKYTYNNNELKERTQSEIDTIASPLKARQEIISRLLSLDVIIPRSVEDLYEIINKPPHTKVKAAIDEKKALRAQLGVK